jgi:tetratricopeptide (TPR) repeat protein
MAAKRFFLGLFLSGLFIQPLSAEVYKVILRGKVTMADGTPPPFSLALERICSDGSGSAPGPLINKKGEYIWVMEVDPMRTRSCVIRATHAGYSSTSIDISALHGYLNTNINLEPIVVTSQAADPYAIIIAESDTPGRAKKKVKEAMKALDTGKNEEARQLFLAAVQAAPDFARGWHAVGVLSEYTGMQKEAHEFYQKAIEADSKVLPPYMTLVRLCIKTKDWECAAKGADALASADKRNLYPQVRLHSAVALYELKELDRAEASARECVRLDPNHMLPRAEYVLGRILEAKGDLAGAREHMSRYLELDKKAPDSASIQTHINNLGNPQSTATEPELEYLY